MFARQSMFSMLIKLSFSDFGNFMKSWKIQVSHIKMYLKNTYFVNFMELPKSGIPIHRVLDAILKSNYNKKHQIGKLRVRAFQRLKNQCLTTSPSRVMAIWKFYKILKIVRKCIKINDNLVVNGRRFVGQRPFTK